jgi:hypothetical protein
MRPLRARSVLPLVLLALVVLARPSAAEDQPFAQIYTPYLDPRGESELSLSTQASHGQAGGEGTELYHRLEFEHAFADRFSAALYLNAEQFGSFRAPLLFDGPSIEAIYRLGAPGAHPVDAAAYLEVRAKSDETELEPRFLVARRGPRGTLAVNAIGEFEFQRGAEAGGETERRLRLAFGGMRALGPAWNLGLEGWVEQSLDPGAGNPRALFAGPTVALSAGGLRWTAGWQPQLAGVPRSGRGLDLDDFPRSRLRVLVAADL